MNASTQYRMIIFADRGPMEFPMFDFAEQVNGEWLSLSTGKTVEQMNQEAITAFWHELDTVGYTEQRLLKTVSKNYGERLCRAWDKATAHIA
jgi:hypothetical protein